MRRKYSLNLFFIQIATVMLIVNFVAAGLLKKLSEKTSAGSDSQTAHERTGASKQKATDILSTGQYFQDIFSEHLAPLKVEFGHVCENPNEWEQRFERKDFDNNRHSGKIKWGNKRGEYGEQYWDLNH
ncbi:PREDICTED: uncharacterized protein LOC106749605 [Dinoponera quadriceps]|uniref:Uncharacterized protein LOC106749605 n=1 Tax=Dinoponera quadriceps TaxID=609295 RepID=A0A6P3Y385_DINQU|nr:PREDICTED: uncharacterized protein LOC106749605 [Dinoponera quadriceps]